jgi:PIN domain nuclease of toxin-antitoxin system
VSQPILLDASCVLAWAFGESGAQLVEAVLPTAHITSVNLTEVVDKLERRGDEGIEFATDLIAWGLAVVPFGWPHMSSLGLIHDAQTHANSRKRLSLGDRCCLAYGIYQEMKIWTTDSKWLELDLAADIEFIRD